MTNSRLLLRLALVSLAALLAAFQTHTYLRHTLCAGQSEIKEKTKPKKQKAKQITCMQMQVLN